ncbi:MAG TPA: SAM-dependent chlorinase/fluorinase [Stellaceae bacterium]|nr:SAM-dependent chlorinase/fluorinase [Stellaceae bacterium]
MIALFTDFGLSGPYTGQMTAVLRRDAPGVPVVSLFADAPAGAPRPGAYLLAAHAAWFPPATVFLSVVDPGVGGARRALIVEAAGKFYVGPDNGLFEIVQRRDGTSRCWEITWQPPDLSVSFHGRDLFAPVAARLARGEACASLGHPIVPLRQADWPDDLAEIVYIDHYGNALTGLRGSAVPAAARLTARGRTVAPAATFSAVGAGEAFWYVNSNGLAEIAVNRRRASAVLGLAVGTPVAIAP